MHSKNHFLCNCPHLAGSSYGAICNASNSLIKNIEDANISICMSRHFEACPEYINSLRSVVTVAMTNVLLQNRA